MLGPSKFKTQTLVPPLLRPKPVGFKSSDMPIRLSVVNVINNSSYYIY